MPPSSTKTTSPGSTESPSDDETLIVTEPGWKTTPERATDQPLETIPSQSSEWDGESDVDVDELPPPTTSTTETGQSSLASSDIAGIEEIARTVVGLASMLVRAIRSRRLHPDLPPDAWVADVDDQAAIGDPLARIAVRHAPIGKGPTGDMVDGLAVMVGATNYTLKGIGAEAEAAQLADIVPDQNPIGP